MSGLVSRALPRRSEEHEGVRLAATLASLGCSFSESVASSTVGWKLLSTIVLIEWGAVTSSISRPQRPARSAPDRYCMKQPAEESVSQSGLQTRGRAGLPGRGRMAGR